MYYVVSHILKEDNSFTDKLTYFGLPIIFKHNIWKIIVCTFFIYSNRILTTHILTYTSQHIFFN